MTKQITNTKSAKNESEVASLARMVANGFNEISERFDGVEERLERVESSLESVETKVDETNRRIDTIVIPELDAHATRIKTLEEAVI